MHQGGGYSALLTRVRAVRYGSVEGPTAWEDFCDKRMVEIYTEKCKSSNYYKDKKESQVRSDIKRKLDMKGDWFLTPDQAVHYGFADTVEGA